MFYLTSRHGTPLWMRTYRGPYASCAVAATAASELVEHEVFRTVELWLGSTHLATFTKRRT